MRKFLDAGLLGVGSMVACSGGLPIMKSGRQGWLIHASRGSESTPDENFRGMFLARYNQSDNGLHLLWDIIMRSANRYIVIRKISYQHTVLGRFHSEMTILSS